ncbi:MAG: hypothetical protein IGS03_00340 [Candidatus Sericytochromatia bacterium]|nr:hypothetical protein [Candidatus Sericytochromatia bacterium]
MAINPNQPVRPTGFDRNSLADLNKVTRTAFEALTDLVHDADGDQTGLDDVKKALDQLSLQEKVAFGVGTLLSGGALPFASLLPAIEKAPAELAEVFSSEKETPASVQPAKPVKPAPKSED